MKRISRGAPAKGCPPKGSWGDSYIIENPKRSKRVSCYSCIHCLEDRSCIKRPIYIPDVSYTFWIKCEYFELSSDYQNKEYISIVNRYRAYSIKKPKESIKAPESKLSYIKEAIASDNMSHDGKVLILCKPNALKPKTTTESIDDPIIDVTGKSYREIPLNELFEVHTQKHKKNEQSNIETKKTSNKKLNKKVNRLTRKEKLKIKLTYFEENIEPILPNLSIIDKEKKQCPLCNKSTKKIKIYTPIGNMSCQQCLVCGIAFFCFDNLIKLYEAAKKSNKFINWRKVYLIKNTVPNKIK